MIAPKRPEAHDLVVTKLRRFHAKDREDIRIICDIGGVEPETLRGRIEAAYAFADKDDGGRATALANLARVIEYLEGRSREI